MSFAHDNEELHRLIWNSFLSVDDLHQLPNFRFDNRLLQQDGAERNSSSFVFESVAGRNSVCAKSTELHRFLNISFLFHVVLHNVQHLVYSLIGGMLSTTALR